jgi:uncharacterized delta-60 repeat protein
VSHSMYRRRRWRTFATTIALSLASLAVPAAALADGQLDPSFNGTGFNVGTVGAGTVFANADTRIPMVVQADGKIVVGGSSNGFMTLVRYNTNGTIDTTFGTNGFATAQFAGTPGSTPGNSGATALTLSGTNIIAAGFGASQSMVVASFSNTGVLGGAVVCYAPHLIDYTARAVTVLSGTTVALAGYARDRWPTQALPTPGPAVLYGERAVVTIPATGTSTTACGLDQTSGTGTTLGSSGVTIDGLSHDGLTADPTQGGRWYDGVAMVSATSYVVASNNGPDANAAAGNDSWILRFVGANAATPTPGILDTTFNPLGTGSILAVPGRVVVPNANLHAIKLNGTNVIAVGESVGGTADSRQMLATSLATGGTFNAGFGSGGIATTEVGGGNDLGQAFTFQGTNNANIIIAGGANLAGTTAFGLTRINTTTGAVDPTFGSNGQTVTPFGTPAYNGYATGVAVNGNLLAVSGRLTDPVSGLDVVAARYFATGSPPPPPPAPGASTMGVDQITTSSARITGTVNENGQAGTWWIEYGPTAAYGATTAPQALGASTEDINVQAVISGLAPGTAYHAAVVTSTVGGTIAGGDAAFTTLGNSTGTTGGGTTGGGTTGGGTGGGSKVTTKSKKVVKTCVVPKGLLGKKINPARSLIYSKGCKVAVVYKKSHKKKGTVIAINRKVGKKLVYRALVKVTVAVKFV